MAILLVIVDYTLASGFLFILLPYTLYIHFKNKRWRKNPQIGDVCYFTNPLGAKTRATIYNIHVDKVFIKTAAYSQWSSIKDLRKY